MDDNGIVLGSPETRRHSIIIFAEPGNGGLGKSMGSFFSKYWQWLVGAIVLPLFLAWFTTRRKRKTEEYHAATVPGTVNKNRKRKKKNN